MELKETLIDFLEEIQEELNKIIEPYFNKELTCEIVEEIDFKIGDNIKVVFYDNLGNSNYYIAINDYLDFYENIDKKVVIKSSPRLVKECHNLIYYSDLDMLIFDIECEILERE